MESSDHMEDTIKCVSPAMPSRGLIWRCEWFRELDYGGLVLLIERLIRRQLEGAAGSWLPPCRVRGRRAPNSQTGQAQFCFSISGIIHRCLMRV